MKRDYVKPAMKMALMNTTAQLLSGSTVKNVSGNANLIYGGGGSGPARARSNNVWEDSWEEEE